MSITIEILIKGYNNESCKRQPWYTVRVLKNVLEAIPDNKVVITDKTIGEEADISIRCTSLFVRHPRKRRSFEYSLEVFPNLSRQELFHLSRAAIFQNWSPLYKLVISYFIPRSKKRDRRIYISSRTGLSREDLFFPPVDLSEFSDKKYVDKSCANRTKIIGYLGPPYESRHYTDVLEFLSKFLRKNTEWKGKVLTRIERPSLKALHLIACDKVSPPSSLEFISGMLDRERFLEELSSIDVLVLPFNYVMSEMPIVVYEALLSGKPVIITKNVLPNLDSLGSKRIFVVDNFKTMEYNAAEKFIHAAQKYNPQDIYNEVVHQRQIFVSKIMSNFYHEKDKS